MAGAFKPGYACTTGAVSFKMHWWRCPPNVHGSVRFSWFPYRHHHQYSSSTRLPRFCGASSLLSEAALSPHKPHAFERLPHTGGGNLAIAPGPLAEENPDGGVTEGYQGHGHTIAIVKVILPLRTASRTCHQMLQSTAVVGALKEVKRKRFIRHRREVHMKCQRTKTKEARTSPWRGRRRRS